MTDRPMTAWEAVALLLLWCLVIPGLCVAVITVPLWAR